MWYQRREGIHFNRQRISMDVVVVGSPWAFLSMLLRRSGSSRVDGHGGHDCEETRALSVSFLSVASGPRSDSPGKRAVEINQIPL